MNEAPSDEVPKVQWAEKKIKRKMIEKVVVKFKFRRLRLPPYSEGFLNEWPKNGENSRLAAGVRTA